jgi:hypothetical protein
MIVEVFISQRQAENTLRQQIVNTVINAIRIAMIGETIRKLANDSGLSFDLLEKNTTGIGTDATPIKLCHQGCSAPLRRFCYNAK